MAMEILRVGDRILWSGGWGSKEPKEATVLRIWKSASNYPSRGNEVNQISLKDENFRVDLDNGNWAWSWQICKPKILSHK
jgi:hypothetical protein